MSAMPRSLAGRLFLQSAVVLAVFVAAAGVLGDRFLARWETGRVARDLERVAWAAAEGLRTVPAQVLGERVRELSDRTGLRFTVIAADGRVLADSHRDPATMENHAGRPEVREALAGRTGVARRRSASIGEPLLYVAVPGTPVVRAAQSLASVARVRAEMRRRVALAALGGVAAALVLAWWFSRSLTRRIGALTRFATRAAEGDLGADLAVHGADDLADLERALLALRDGLRQDLAEIRREHERLQALLEHLPDGVLVLGGDGRVRLANPAARRILRLRDDPTVHTGPEVLRHPDLLEALDGWSRDPEAAAEPVAVDWPDPPCRLLVRFVPFPDETGRPGTLVVLRDVTRQHELERMRTDFVANLGHELRTPLTAIRGAAETLRHTALGDPAATLRFVEAIHRNALRLEALLRDVSDLARIEAGGAPVFLIPLDAREPVRQVVEMFRAEAEKAGVNLEARVPPAEVPADLDAEKVESILVNLVQNAVRYTPRGGRVWAEVAADADTVAFAVEDTGIGIPPHEIPRVTERFYRVDPARSRATGGTGLGLAIVKHLTELLGGTLRIESRPGHGTRVTVTLPRHPAHA